MPPLPGSLRLLSSGSFCHARVQMYVIRQARRAQHTGHGNRAIPSVSELYDLAKEKGFGDRMAEAHNNYLDACEGRKAVIDKLSVKGSEGSGQKLDTMLTFSGGVLVQDGPRGYLGPDVMSSVLQLPKLFANAASGNNDKPETPVGVPGAVASCPEGWHRKYLPKGQTETQGKRGLVQDALEDSKALKLILLLNTILDRGVFLKHRDVALRPCEFKMSDVDNESECARPFQQITRKAETLLEVLYPRLGVEINSHKVVGGITDVYVEVNGVHQRGALRTEYPAIIELKGPSCAYQAANGCRNMAVSDRCSFVGTHLRQLTEIHDNLTEANVNSHYALDMTEDGSAVKMMQYFINAAFRSVRVRRHIQILLEVAGERCGVKRDETKVAARYKSVVAQNIYFKSTRELNSYAVSVMRNALAHWGQAYGAAIAESGEYESLDFDTIECYRSDGLGETPPPESSSNQILGRSRSVAKVQFYGDDDAIGGEQSNGSGVLSQRPFVLKVYDADPWSILQMEGELEAYFRTSQLAGADQKSVAKLLAFGAIDLEDVDPRLFIALEYVDGPATDTPPYKQKEHELARVRNILKSVGVRHNDLEERNYRWQLEDGKWFIKVFDFDLATFDDDHDNGAVKGVSKTARCRECWFWVK